ncbi:transcription factor HEC2-like [Camellia sinensis]|uniref:BHLH domain-containing protein n=1 Tax=Camellia sinensis var. sinensis TaxID=542762 RepID=A0A4S4F2R5_CAMSN|nr:transcription factor HEC2-like [Camellia sinensis]THG23205.1 hypothetical protein TEA_027561 [Camellia sinensis var. sinensis]
MDIDLLKSPSEDQIDMIMMLQMDKLHVPDFCGGYSDVGDQMSRTSLEFPTVLGSSSSSSNVRTATQMIENPHVSPSFMNPPSTTLSFGGGGGVQEPAELPFLSNSGRWRGGGGGEFPFPATTQSQKRNSMAAMREMIFRIAAMQPIHIDPESVKPPKRRNVKISKDPQSVAARHRREKISERIRILQRLVPGGTKMDTASMLDEAIHYVKFLKTQVQSLERAATNRPPPPTTGIGFPVSVSNGIYLPGVKGYQTAQSLEQYSDA